MIMLGGFSIVAQANWMELIEWTCPPGTSGTILSVSVNASCRDAFLLLEFYQKRGAEIIERLTDYKELPPTTTTAGGTTYTLPNWSGGLHMVCFHDLCAGGIPWLLEEGDVVGARIYNRSAAHQFFDMAIKVGGCAEHSDCREHHALGNECARRSIGS